MTITFVVVALSSAVQGVPLNRVIPKQISADDQDTGLVEIEVSDVADQPSSNI